MLKSVTRPLSLRIAETGEGHFTLWILGTLVCWHRVEKVPLAVFGESALVQI